MPTHRATYGARFSRARSHPGHTRTHAPVCCAERRMTWLAGVDGCPGGWIVAFLRLQGEEARIAVMPRFVDVLAAEEAPAIVAVDVPIGLPERAGPGG